MISKTKLTKKQKKYCDCLMKVRTQKGYNPYAICKTSVLKTKKERSQNPECVLNYNYNKFNNKQIRALAKEKHIKLSHKNRKTGKTVKHSRKNLISMIKKQATRK